MTSPVDPSQSNGRIEPEGQPAEPEGQSDSTTPPDPSADVESTTESRQPPLGGHVPATLMTLPSRNSPIPPSVTEEDIFAPSSYAGLSPSMGPVTAVTVVALAVILTGIVFNSFWFTLAGSLVALVIAVRLSWPAVLVLLRELSPQQQSLLIAIPALIVGLLGLMQISGINQAILDVGRTLNWDVIGALGDFFGAFGQIFIAMLALYVAWREYVISRDLTAQQNRITQQQTIDAYFQGISDLVLDDEGLLEDWPQERMIAEARTASILSSIDASGKAKVIRFLSRSKLLTPLRRDGHLGRPILDGRGGYEEDRSGGTRVISLGAMLAATHLANNDLRWADFSEANLIRADLSRCDLVKANLSRTILYQANLSGADLMGARFFYGELETASPRIKTGIPDYRTGAYTGAVVEGANFTGAQRLSEEQRQYCCAWGGSATRSTIPGGCDDVPNLLGR